MDKWVPAEAKKDINGKTTYFALTTQTFTQVGGVMNWLDEHGFIRRRYDEDEGEFYWVGWGNPYFAVKDKATFLT